MLSTAGRLDRGPSGLLLFSDHGTPLQRIISPQSKLPKVCAAALAPGLRGCAAATFASGGLLLESGREPLCRCRWKRPARALRA